MGMALAMVTIGDANISRLRQDPALVWLLIAPDDPDTYWGEKTEKAGLWDRLLGRKNSTDQSKLPTLVLQDGEGEEDDIDKAWHGIHYLLTGTAREGEHPLNFIVSGGEEVGDIEVGYGPARILGPSLLGEILAALNALEEEELKKRYDPKSMKELDIYPDIWNRDPKEDDGLGYCLENLSRLQEYFSRAVKKSLGVVIYLC